MERVSIIEGKKPILVIAPHGFSGDDENTNVLAEGIANVLGAYAVINNGWERGDAVDIFNDKADCNNVHHIHEDVVKDEFLDPILKFRSRILKTNDILHMYMIHGMANRHRDISGEPKLDIVVGYGAGSPDSYSCDLWRKNCFINLLGDAGLVAYEGKRGGQMSGWSKSNVNQLFRKWYTDPRVQSMQLEIIHDLRNNVDVIQLASEYLAAVMNDMLGRTGYKSLSNNKQY